MKAKKWVLVQHFQGEPKDENLRLEEEELRPLKQGGIVIYHFIKHM